MNSFKNLAILILGFALFQATLASTRCNVHLFKNPLTDVNQDNLYQYWIQDLPDYVNAPFHGISGNGDNEERTLSSFRALVVDLDECGPCTVVGYSGKNLSGKKFEQYVGWGSDGQVDFDFCVKSYTFDCEATHVEEEEEEAEEEEEEEEQQE